MPPKYLGSPALFAELLCWSTRFCLFGSEGPELAEVWWDTDQRPILIQFLTLGRRPLGRPPGVEGVEEETLSLSSSFLPLPGLTSRAARRQDVDIFSHTHTLGVTWQWKPPAESLLSRSHGSPDVRQWSWTLRPFIYYSNIYSCFSSLALRLYFTPPWEGPPYSEFQMISIKTLSGAGRKEQRKKNESITWQWGGSFFTWSSTIGTPESSSH